MSKYSPGERVQCPHCKTSVRLEGPESHTSGDYWFELDSSRNHMQITFAQCPQFLQFLITAEEVQGKPRFQEIIKEHLLWPFSFARDPISSEVPDHIAADYSEAALVLPFSPKASAALSRRCLQTILREAGKTKAKDLSYQIDEVLPTLPSTIAPNLDTVRVIGNFAAHPIKSQNTGEIIDVEPGEAEWNLDVIDSLFDFYYVRPNLEKRKREEINKKLKDAGKPCVRKLEHLAYSPRD